MDIGIDAIIAYTFQYASLDMPYENQTTITLPPT